MSKGATPLETVEVNPTGSENVLVRFAEDETAVVSVTWPTITTVSRELSRDCQRPGATVGGVVCAEGGGEGGGEVR